MLGHQQSGVKAAIQDAQGVDADQPVAGWVAATIARRLGRLLWSGAVGWNRLVLGHGCLPSYS